MNILIKKCPKCSHMRRPEETDAPERCPACGLYFEKWVARSEIARRHTRDQPQDNRPAWFAMLQEHLTADPVQFTRKELHARIGMLIFLAIWGARLVRLDYRTGEINRSFMHAILLPIHEAGHIFLRPFGEFMTILGGSLFQLLFPLIVATTILWQNRDRFGALLGVWWCAASLIDLSPYIYDAKDPQLIMLGGHTGEDGPHDWIYLLGVFGKIERSQAYGAIAHALGALLMLITVIAAALVLYRAWETRIKAG